MAPADKKKPKVTSKSKAPPAVQQKTILDLLTKKRPPLAKSDEAPARQSENSAQEGLACTDGGDSARLAADPSVASLSDTVKPELQNNIHEGKAPRKKQNLKPKTNDTKVGIIDITDLHRPMPGLSNLAPPATIFSTSKHSTVRTEPSLEDPFVERPRSDGGTRQDPIVLDSSPIKPQPPVDLAKPTYSIFAPRKLPHQLSSPSKSKLGKADKLLNTPFPNRTSQHVRGPQSEFIVPPLHLGRLMRIEKIIDVDQVSTPLDLFGFGTNIMSQNDHHSRPPEPVIQTIQPSNRDQYIKDIPDEYISAHPAISYLIQQFTSSSTSRKLCPSQDLWADKWRPRCADHVLGNEHHALYLRDWLSALELQLESRPESPQKLQSNSKLKTKAMTTVMNLETKNTKMKGNRDDNSKKGVKRPRPRVVRAVHKIRGRKKQRLDSDEDEDWIVNTDDEDTMEQDRYAEESEEDGEDDDVAFCRKQTLSRLRRVESSPAPPSTLLPSVPPINHPAMSVSDLHNTLLLAGPPGSGKTAAVYACAKELGWDVFEVYPGVGKRSGQGLDQLVGEVGKNHLVRNAGTRKKDLEGKKNAFVEIFGKTLDMNTNDGTEREPIEVEVDGDEGRSGGGKKSNIDFGFLVPSRSAETPNSDPNTKGQTSEQIPGVRQSMILLEEVDILFDEDRGFWTAAINIIKDCRRPVIITCNDINLVPTLDLPLQSILFFQSCPPPVAASYLQALCLAEGRLLDRNFLVDLCEATCRIDAFDMPDSPLNPVTEVLPVPDLRRAIHHLQLWASDDSAIKTESSEIHAVSLCEITRDEHLENLADWTSVLVRPVASANGAEKQSQLPQSLISHVETLSFIDSYLTRMPLDTPEALVFNDHDPSPDDAIGHTHIFNASGVSKGLSCYCQDEIIYEDVLRHSCGILKASKNPRTTFKTRALFRARVEHQSKMHDLLWPGLVPLQSHLLPRPAVFLDYVPYVKYMAHIDDVYERTGDWEASVNPRSGRPIRNSTRGSYERQLTLSDHQREIIAATRLDEFEVD